MTGRALFAAWAIVLVGSSLDAVASEQDVPTWTALQQNQFALGVPAMAIDGPNHRAYLFGGMNGPFASAAVYTQDLDQPTVDWQEVPTSGGPQGRAWPHAHLDAAGGRLIVLGGVAPVGKQFHTDVWAMDLVTHAWTEITPPTGGPDSLWGADPLVHDTRRNRLVYVATHNGTRAADVWSLDLSSPALSWSPIAIENAPVVPPRSAAAYDSIGNRVFLLRAGANEFAGLGDLLLELELETPRWLLEGETAPPLHLVSPRMGWDPVTNRLVAQGWDRFHTGHHVTYDLAGGGWQSHVVPGEPATGSIPVWAFDPVAGALHLVESDSRPAYFATLSTRPSFAWSTRHRSGWPSIQFGAAGAVDPPGRAWYVQGGNSAFAEDCGPGAPPCISGRLFRIDLDDPSHFEALTPPGGGPGRIRDHSAVWDSAGHRIVFYGGRDASDTYSTKVWALNLGPPLVWSEVATDVPRPARAMHGAAIDPARRWMYVVSGRSPGGQLVGELWRLDLSQPQAEWTKLPVTTPAREPRGTGFDPVARRLLFVIESDGYAIDLATDPPVLSPPVSMGPRSGVMAAFDTRRNRVFAHNGYLLSSSTGVFDPENTLSFGGSGTLGFVDLGAVGNQSTPTWGASAAYDPVTDRMLLLNGKILGIDWRGDPALLDLYGLWQLQLDFVTPTRMDFAEAAVEGRTIRIRFAGEGLEGELRVERTESSADAWEDLGRAAENTPGVFDFVDPDPVPGWVYLYRGRFRDGDGERVTATSPAIGLPAQAARLGLRAVGGTIARGWPLEVEYRLASTASAHLELFDVTGRVVARQSLLGAAGQSGTVRLSPGRACGPGLYFVRLHDGTSTGALRVIRL